MRWKGRQTATQTEEGWEGKNSDDSGRVERSCRYSRMLFIIVTEREAEIEERFLFFELKKGTCQRVRQHTQKGRRVKTRMKKA
jgi:hypothetical protein